MNPLDELTEFFKKNQKNPPANTLEIIMHRIEQQSGESRKGRDTMQKRSRLIFAFSFIIVAAFIAILTYHFMSSTDVSQGVPQKAYVTFIMGHAEMESSDGSIIKIRVGQEVTNARVLRTRSGSRLDLRLSGGSAFSISEGTELKLSSFLTAQQNNERTNIDLFRGRLLIEPNKIRGDGNFDVNTPTAVAGVRGTRFTIAYNPEREATRVAVQKGTVSVRRKLSLDISDGARQKVISSIGSQRSVQHGETVLISRETNEQISEVLNRDIDTLQRNISANENIEQVPSIIQARRIAGIQSAGLNQQDNAIFNESINREQVRTVRLEVNNQGGVLSINGIESPENTYSGEFAPGAQVSIKLVKPGYKIFERTVIIPDYVSVYKPYIELQRPVITVTVQREMAIPRLAVKYHSGVKPATAVIEENNKLFYAGTDGNFYAINMENTGEIEWKTSIPAAIESTPVLQNGRIYFGARNGMIYVLDAKNGKILWSRKYGTMLFKSSIVIKSSRLYFGTVEGNVYTVNRENGDIIWNKKFPAGIWNTVAVGNQAVFAGCEDGYVYALERNSGKELWKRDLGSRVIAPVLVIGSRIIATNYSGQAFGLQADSGSIIWKKEIGAFTSIPEISGESVFFTRQGLLTVIHSADGNITLNKRLYGKVNAFVSQNRLFITSGRNNVSEFSTTGAEIWTYKIDGNIFLKPLSNERFVYTVLTNGTILKLNRTVKKIVSVQEQRAQ